MTASAKFSLVYTSSPELDFVHPPPSTKLGFAKFRTTSIGYLRNMTSTSKNLAPIKAMEGSRMPSYVEVKPNGHAVTNDSNGKISLKTL